MSQNQEELVEVSEQGPIGVVTLNRAEKMNAINFDMVRDIAASFDRFAQTPAIKAIVLKASGSHFSAGFDIGKDVDMTQVDLIEAMENARSWEKAMQAIQFGAKPVVAALPGAVIGGGLELAACAHVRVGGPDTFFQLPEGALGVFVGGGATITVSRLIGPDRLTELLLTGRRMSAQEGLERGLIHYLDEDVEHRAFELASKIAQNHDFSNYLAIHAPARADAMAPQSAFFTEEMASILVRYAPESQRRLKQFLQRKAENKPKA